MIGKEYAIALFAKLFLVYLRIYLILHIFIRFMFHDYIYILESSLGIVLKAFDDKGE